MRIIYNYENNYKFISYFNLIACQPAKSLQIMRQYVYVKRFIQTNAFSNYDRRNFCRFLHLILILHFYISKKQMSDNQKLIIE